MENNENLKPVVSIKEYRKLLNDYVSTDEIIEKRIRYLEAFCTNIIKLELDKHSIDNTNGNLSKI